MRARYAQWVWGAMSIGCLEAHDCRDLLTCVEPTEASGAAASDDDSGASIAAREEAVPDRGEVDVDASQGIQRPDATESETGRDNPDSGGLTESSADAGNGVRIDETVSDAAVDASVQGPEGQLPLTEAGTSELVDAGSGTATAAQDEASLSFDDDFPPPFPWTLSQTGEMSLGVGSAVSVSGGNSLEISVPTDGTESAELAWTLNGENAVSSVALAFAMNVAPLVAAPPPWPAPVPFACIELGRVGYCLAYTHGSGYTVEIDDNRSVRKLTSCELDFSPTRGLWTGVQLTVSNTGTVAFVTDTGVDATCLGPSVVETAPRVALGYWPRESSHPGLTLRIDDVTILVLRDAD